MFGFLARFSTLDGGMMNVLTKSQEEKKGFRGCERSARYLNSIIFAFSFLMFYRLARLKKVRKKWL